VTAALRALAGRYGPYPWSAYTLAITSHLRGGIEYPGHVMQGPATTGRTTPHEAAHQWFYALVGSDQGRDPWLDEGLATWAEGQLEGTAAAMAHRLIPAVGRGHLSQPMTYWETRAAAYYPSVYVQTVRALSVVDPSPSRIDCALARYVAANAYRVATPAALTAALTAVAPQAAAVLAGFG